jgi:glycosyltransferase involved in cell wall biosynthesis
VALAEEMDTAGAGIATEPEPSAIAGALDRLLSDDRLCTEMGARAAALASQRFSADAMGAGLAELYARIIQETGRTVSPSAAADTETSRDSRIANRSAAQP